MEEKKGNINQRRKKKVAFVLFPAIIILGAVILYFYLQYKKTHISTDDAFVDGRVHVIASKIPGTVRVIHIIDNQFVKKNDLLLEIDPVDYDVKVREAQADLQADFNTIFLPRVVLGVGMGFLFIPLTTMTMSSIRKEEMGYATSMFNLLRNLGGSFGVAFVTTMLARRAQFHQVHLVEHLTPFDRNFQLALPQISQMLQDKGVIPSLSDQGGLGLIYGEVMKQASMLSFNDVFYFLSTMMMFTLPLVLLMKKGNADTSGGGIH